MPLAVLLASVVSLLAAASLFAQTGVTSYSDDFQSYGKSKTIPGWTINTVGRLHPEGAGRFKTRPDPTQGNKGPNLVYGTHSGSGDSESHGDSIHTIASSSVGGPAVSLNDDDDDGGDGDCDDDHHEYNGRNGTFATYTNKSFSAAGRTVYSGRILRNRSDSRVGLTLLSGYPDADRYYLVGILKQSGTNKLTMQLSQYGAGAFTGKTDSGVTLDINKWYSFTIQVEDDGSKTTVRAKFWLDTNAQPTTWSIEASDASTKRLKTGRIGMWEADKGDSYIDDINVKSPVDFTAPTIKFLESGQTLVDNTKYTRVPSPEIVVTDDLSTVTYTAKLDGAAYTSKTPVTAQGSHTLTVHAVDSVGNASDGTVHFFVDTESPKVTVTAPLQNSMSGNDVTVAMQITDISLPATTKATLDNVTYDVTKPITAEGKHVLAITVTDALGLVTVVPPITFTIDKSAPAYTLKDGTSVFPADGFVFDRDVTVNIDVQDLTPTTVKMTLDGATYTPGTPISSERSHVLAGSVADSVGHTTPIAPRNFTIDKTAPVVAVSEGSNPLNTYYDRSVKPEIKITDASATTYTATLNDAPFRFDATLSEEKKYTLAGSVTDSARHTTPFGPFVFYIDKTAPQVTLTANGNAFPPSGAIFDAAVTIAMTVNDLTPVTKSVTLDNAAVTLPLTLSTEGAHKISVTVTDSLNHATTIGPIDFVLDKSAPVVVVQESGSALEDGRFFNRKVVPQIVVTDSTPTTTNATLDNAPFTSGTEVTAQGLHTIAGSVSDSAHHTVPIGPVTFTIDTVNPTGIFKEGANAFPDGKSVNRDVTARVEITDATPTTATVLLDGDPYVEGTPITSEQAHTLTATLVDKAGNHGTVPSISFRIDRTAPKVTLLANDGPLTAATKPFGVDVVLSVNVTDDSATTVTATLDGQTVTLPFTVTNDAQHSITVTAVDAAGNAAPPLTVPFIVEKTAPKATVLLNGSAAQANPVFGASVSVTVQTDTGLTARTKSVTVDDAPYVEGTPVTGEGAHQVGGTVTSGAGVSAPVPQTNFTIDTKPPVVTVLESGIALESGKFFKRTVTPVINATDTTTTTTTHATLNGNAYISGTPVTADGTYTLAGTVTDAANNSANIGPVTFTIDTRAPSGVFKEGNNDFPDGQIVNRDVSAHVVADESPVTIDILLDGKAYTANTPIPTEDLHTLTATVTDQAGNSAPVKAVSVRIDRTPPTVKILAGGNDLLAHQNFSGDVVLSVLVDDASPTTVTGKLDGATVSFPVTVTAEGPHTINATAVDAAGNPFTTATLDFVVDRTPPKVTVLENGTAAQPNAVFGVDVAVTLQLDSGYTSRTAQITLDGNAYVEGTLITAEGKHEIGGTVANGAGVTAPIPQTIFTIDKTPPQVTLLNRDLPFPASGAYVNADVVPVAKCTDNLTDCKTRLVLDGNAWPNNQAITAEGPHTIVASATDDAGNKSADITVSFFIDKTAPTGVFKEGTADFPAGRALNRDVTAHVVPTDASPVTSSILLDGQAYTDNAAISAEGDHTLTASLTDAAGNHGSVPAVSFRIDKTVPVVKITAGGADLVANDAFSADVTLDVHVTDVSTTTSTGTLDGAAVTFPHVVTTEGSHTIAATSTDAAGNIGNAGPLTFILEKTPPKVTVLENGNDAQPNDVFGVDVHVTLRIDTGLTARTASITLDGNPYVAGTAITAEGHHEIGGTVTAASGLSTPIPQTLFIIDKTKPAVTVKNRDEDFQPNGYFYNTDVVPVASCTDNLTRCTPKLMLDGAELHNNTPITAEGAHSLVVSAVDEAGNETTLAPITFTIDKTPPVLTITSPTDGQLLTQPEAIVKGASDDAITVTVNSFPATIDSAAKTYVSSKVPLVEGDNPIVVVGVDQAGNTGTKTIHVLLDTRSPEVVIRSPQPNACLTDADVVISGVVTDPNLSDVAVSIGQTTVPNALESGKQTWSATFHGLAEGPQIVTVVAKDAIGHRSVATLSIVVDRTAPVIEVLESGAPFTARIVNRPVSLFITAKDLDRNVHLTVTLDSTKPYVTGAMITGEGNHHLDIAASDCAGHQIVVPLDFTIDTMPPSLNAITPVNGSTVGTMPSSITGTVSNDAVRVELEGTGIVATPAAGGSFAFTGASIGEGQNLFTVRVTDGAGNVTRIPYQFTVKSQAPQVEIYENGAPLADGAFFNRPVSPVVRANDTTATVTALLDGATYDGSPVTADGSYTIEGRATDNLNHLSTVTRHFSIDRTAPVIKITSPQEGVVTASSIDVGGTSGDAVTVSVNGVVATLSNGNFIAHGVHLEPGENFLVANGSDAHGNNGHDQVLVTVAPPGPGLLITAPADGYLTNRPRIDVTGRVISPTVDGNVTVGSKVVAADSTGAFRVNGYQLVEGDNTITVTAVGQNQQQTSVSVHVTADFTPPALSVLASGQALADNAQFPQAVSISLSASDNRGTVTTTLLVDGVNQTTLPVSVSQNGGHTIVATARDAAGNETRVDRTFFIGNSGGTANGCSIESVDPADGSVISSSTLKVAGRQTASVSIKVGSVAADIADNTYAATINLTSEGANVIDVVCTDGGGLTAKKTVTFVRVTGNPSIKITDPTEGLPLSAAKITVRGTVGDDVVSADVNGVNATITGSNGSRTFSAANITLAPGINIIAAHARNAASRTSSDSVRVRSIQAPPTIDLTAPAAGLQTGASKVSVSGTYRDLNPSTLALTSSAQAGSPVLQVTRIGDTNGSFVFSNVTVSPGEQTYTVTGRNVLNQTTSADVKIIGQAGAASIDITSPADNSYFGGAQPVPIAGTFNGPGTGNIHVDVNGSAATIDGSTYAGSVTFNAAATSLPVIARLIDSNGTGPFATISIRKLAPFKITEVFPANNAQDIDPSVLVLISLTAPPDLTTLSNIVLSANGAPVQGTFFVDDSFTGTTVVAFTPTVLLQSGTTYTLTVPQSLKDVGGHPLDAASVTTFTTATSASAIGPTVDPITVTGCVQQLDITGTAAPFARLRLDAGTISLSGQADANGHFSLPYPITGQSGFQIARVRIVGADGSLSPATEVSFRIDCAGPQVVSASYDRTNNKIAIIFSKPVKSDTLVVGNGGSILLSQTDGSITSGTATIDGNTATVTPADDLTQKSFTLLVNDQVKDLGGNKLVVVYSQVFSLGGGDTPVAGDGSGFISGEVYDATTGRPLAGADVSVNIPVTAFSRPWASAQGRFVTIGTPSTSAPRTSRVGTNAAPQLAVNATAETRGRYTIPLPEGAHTIQASAGGYTTVWRQIVVPAGAGVVPIDIRLTRRGDPKTSDGSSPINLSHGGDSVVTKAVSLSVPGGAVPSGGKISLTSVGAQSLAGLLPLGWSPLASAEIAVFDTNSKVTHAAPLGSAQLSFTLPTADVTAANQVLSLVQYDDDRDEWRTLIPVMSVKSDGKWTESISTSGSYAVVYADKGQGLKQPPVAGAGLTLQPAGDTCVTGSTPCELVQADGGQGFKLDPPIVTPTGRTVARLLIKGQGTATFPSGTAVQAYIDEVLHLSDGSTVIDPPFATDILLYRGLDGTMGEGLFNLAPSVRAATAILSEGVDHIRILQYPGRLDRGTLIGPEGGRVPGDDNVSIEVPTGATTEPLHASVSSMSASDIAALPQIAGFQVVGGFTLTMTRATENPDAGPVELSRPARATVAVNTNGLPANAQILLAEILDGTDFGQLFRLADPMSAIDTPQNGVNVVRYTTRSIDPSQFPVDGLVREGRYLVLASQAPIAWATGAVRAGGTGSFFANTRIRSATLPGSVLLGVADLTRATGVFAIPIAADPATGFVVQVHHPDLGDGAPINRTPAPAADTVVHLGDVTMVAQSPTLVSHVPASGAQVDVSSPLIITLNFSDPIDPSSAATAIAVSNATANEAVRGTVNVTGSVVTFTPSTALSAGSQYAVAINTSLRGINGSPLARSESFVFSTKSAPSNGTIDAKKIHITIPDDRGVSRVFGDPGALPTGWTALPVRLKNDFLTRYQAKAAGDGAFSMNIGDGGDESDRVTLDDIIDLRVINAAGNIAAVIHLTPFVDPDGKGFIAPFGVTTTFQSVEGISITVPAGAFDEPKRIHVAFEPNADAFSQVPNIANELNLLKVVKLEFAGKAKERLDVSFPVGNLPTDHDLYLGWLGQSAWGPRVAVADTLRIENGQFTTSYPSQSTIHNMISAQSKKVGPNSGLTDLTIKSCLVGVTGQGSYALMDFTMNVPGGGLGWAVTWGLTIQVELLNDLFHSIYLPDFAFSSRNNCAAMPIIKGKPFTLTGVDPATGMVQFKTAYDPIPITDPAVVTIPSPNADKKGPYPVYGTPWRIETTDMTGDTFIGRGYKLVFQDNGTSSKILLQAPDLPRVKEENIAEKATVRMYNATKGLFSSSQVVDANGGFSDAYTAGDRGDQIIVYIGTADISADTTMNVVFSEPIKTGTFPATPPPSEDEKKKIIDDYFHTVTKLELIENNTPSTITDRASFSMDSQNRRLWITMPAPLTRGATYRLTLLKSLEDTNGNKLGLLLDKNNVPQGNGPQDIPLEFKVRDNPKDLLSTFTLQAIPAYGGGSLRDLAKSGNLAFVSALDAGIIVYDLSDTDALKTSGTTQPTPYSLVPARWTDSSGSLLPGANGFEQYWGITTDIHNRIFGAGVTSQFSVLRIYKVEDFVKAHEDNNGDQCDGYPDAPKNSNCEFHGATILGWRPGYSSNLPLSTGLVMTDYPEAYPRKVQIASQDDTKKYKDFAEMEKASTTIPTDFIKILNKTELGTNSGNFKFDLQLLAPKTPGMMTPEEKQGYVSQRVTLLNTDLGLSWSVDQYLGESAVISQVIARKHDHLVLVRNQTTYAITTLLGFGAGVSDLRAVESNDVSGKCGIPSFASQYPLMCTQIVPGHKRLLEKIIHTKGDGNCDGKPPFDPGAGGIPNIEFSGEDLGLIPEQKDPSGASSYDKLHIFGLDARRGVLDLTYPLPTDGTQPVEKCATRPGNGLIIRDPQTNIVHPRLTAIKSAVSSGNGAIAIRFNSQAMYHWELPADRNTKGVRGSTPGTAVSHDYLLVPGGAYGLLVVEVGGTLQPNSPITYDHLDPESLADVIWLASGCYAVRVIPNTNTAVVLDGVGHVLLVDLTNIDERWDNTNPIPAGGSASMTSIDTPFPLTNQALGSTPLNSDEIGIDDPRVMYKSDYKFNGVIPPLVDVETGIAFGGDSVTQNMKTAALLDPPVKFVVDLGDGLEPATGIVPLGVEPPVRNPNVATTDPAHDFPKGSLAAFRVRVSLPGSIARVLDGQKLQFAVESERMPAATTEQTPVSLPPAHIRRNDRGGTEDKRPIDLVFTRELALDPTATDAQLASKYRHQEGFNHLVSPWIVAIADPRASEKVKGSAQNKKDAGCVSCERPDALHLKDQQNDHVFELMTMGRWISVRPDSNTGGTAMTDALKGVYDYLGDNGRLEVRVPTTMADTVRGRTLTVAAQDPPVASGALSETTYVHSGEVEVSAVDVVIPGRAGNDIPIMRTHRSRTIGSTLLGVGWEAPFLRRLRQLPNGKVEYRDGLGEVWLFEPDTAAASYNPPPPPPPPTGAAPGSSGSGATVAQALDVSFGTRIKYKSPKGLFLRLARNENGWMLYDQKWRISRFDNYGRLTSESDEFWQPKDVTPSPGGSGTPPPPPAPSASIEPGNTTFYLYDGKGLLKQIIDPTGRKSDLDYWQSSDPNSASCTALNTNRQNFCTYAGLLKQVKDWRKREVLFEYDKYGRLIGVQRPKTTAGTGSPSYTDFSTDDRRPRVAYTYKTPSAPTGNEGLDNDVVTDFMDFSGNIETIIDAAEGGPGPNGQPATNRPRVKFDYYNTAAGTPSRDHVQYQYWPCGDFDGNTCSETKATFEYPSVTSTKVTDMLGQERDYDFEEVFDPLPAGAAAGTQPVSRYVHVKQETVVKAPVMANSSALPTATDAPTPTDLITKYTEFDEEGSVKEMTLPNNTIVKYTTVEASNGAPGRVLTDINESGGGKTRDTKYVYDTDPSHPNAAATATKVGRKKLPPNPGNDYTYRDMQSPSRDQKSVQQRDKSIGVKTEVTYDVYGRPKDIEQRKDDGSPTSTPGSGDLTEHHEITYKDSASASDIEKGRVDHVRGTSPSSGTSTDPPPDIQYDYYTLPQGGPSNGGQQVVAHDLTRGTFTTTDYDALDRPTHVVLTQGNDILAETWTGYDASGRVIYSARRQEPLGRVESFTTFDPLARPVETKINGNIINDVTPPSELVMTTQYQVSAKIVITLDPAAPGTTTAAKQTTFLDSVGRTEKTERKGLVPPTNPGVDPIVVTGAMGYDNTGATSFASDTVRVAGRTTHDAFGRVSSNISSDGLKSDQVYDEWDQVIESTSYATDGTTIAHAKSKYTDDGHVRSINEQVDAGTTPRFRQTFRTWEDGGKKTGERIGAATSFDTDLSGSDVRATARTSDQSGRLLDELYGAATGTTGNITPIHRRTFTGYQGGIPQYITDYQPLRGSTVSSQTQQALDGLDRVRVLTVGATGPAITGYQTRTDYDQAGNVTHFEPPAGKGTVDRKYDGRGLITEEKRGIDTIRRFYDERGVLRRYRDESLLDTTYEVDDLGRVVKINYPDSPQTSEQIEFENKSGLVKARRDRKGVWLSYVYDNGGRVTEIHNGEDPTSALSPLLTRFEYDVAKRMVRAVNKDSAIEFAGFDMKGHPATTRTIRYADGTGFEISTLFQKVLDVHSQHHEWSVFGERPKWRMPVTGSDPTTSNKAPWHTEITENRDASTNVISQVEGATTITTGAPGGIGTLTQRTRKAGSMTLTSDYGYADLPIPGLMPQAQTGMLRKMETKVAGATVAGSEIFHDSSQRIGESDDLAFASRQSRWTYDDRGRLETTKLLVPDPAINFATPIKDHLTGTTFRAEREATTLFGPIEHARLGDARSFAVEPPKWTATEKPGHQIDVKTYFLDGAPKIDWTHSFTFDGGRRKSDGVWTSAFDELGRLTSLESADRRIEYVYDAQGRIVGRHAFEHDNSPTVPPGSWKTETRASVLLADTMPAETTWIWDPLVDRLVAIYETGHSTIPTGSTTQPAPEAGLLRQYLHGDRGYDDPVEVLVADQVGDTPKRYFPLFDEAGTGSLQAVVDASGNVVERVLYGDSYGDAPRYLTGPVVEKITYASTTAGGVPTDVHIRVRMSEKVKDTTIAGGVRLAALKTDGTIAATATTAATLDADDVTIHWQLTGAEWNALTTAPGATAIEVAVTSSLRTKSWGDTPVAPAPEFAQTLFGAKFSAANPVMVGTGIAYLASLSGSGNEETLYEVKNLYMAGQQYSSTRMLMSFQALPYQEPANGLIFARARWFDPATGTFLSPDPMGYQDASSLYAFAGGDPVNERDPSGERVATDEENARIASLRAHKARVLIDFQKFGMAEGTVYMRRPNTDVLVARVEDIPMEFLPTPYLLKDQYSVDCYVKQVDEDIAAYEKQIEKAKRGETVTYTPIGKLRGESAFRTLQWIQVGSAVVDVVGSFAAVAEHRSNIAQLDRMAPFGMSPPQGFKGYADAERAIDLTPKTLAEIEDALRLNAVAADTHAANLNLSRRNGVYGTIAHSEFEALNIQLNQIIQRAGSGYEVRVEEFRDANGAITGRRAADSRGLDVVVYYRGNPVAGFDLKTGRGWSARQLAVIQQRFNVPITEIHTR